MSNRRTGFTLVELLITVAIIGIMASMVMFAMFSATEAAKRQKTRALITKLNNIIMERYDSYRTRRVPFVFPEPPVTTNVAVKKQYQQAVAKARIDCLRDLMRMEMPDRWSDVTDAPAAPYAHGYGGFSAFNGTMFRPSVNQAYLAKHTALNPSIDNQGAECLYMIVMEGLAQEGDSRDVFKPGDTADVDSDGAREFVDGWGSPIEFIRWAPGYQSDLQTPIRIDATVGGSGAGPNAVSVTVTGNAGKRLSQTPGSYVGGAMALIDPVSKIIDTRSMAKITGYTYDNTVFPPQVMFTCETPSYTQQKPFGGNNPSGEFVVMEADPFDSRSVYPIYPNGASSFPSGSPDTSVPNYAIYPLIISKGADKTMGVKDGAGGGNTLRYADYSKTALNPFWVADPLPGRPFGMMLGSIHVINDNEPNWYKGCHVDNITSHDLNRR